RRISIARQLARRQKNGRLSRRPFCFPAEQAGPRYSNRKLTSTSASYLSPSGLNRHIESARMTSRSNTRGGLALTILTSVTEPFSSTCRRATTLPLSTPSRRALSGKTGSTLSIGTRPRRIAGLGAGGGGAGGGGAITCGSGGGVIDGAAITGSEGATGGGISGGGTYGCSGGGGALGISIFFGGGGGGGGGSLISSMIVAVSGFLITSTALRARPVTSA